MLALTVQLAVVVVLALALWRVRASRIVRAHRWRELIAGHPLGPHARIEDFVAHSRLAHEELLRERDAAIRLAFFDGLTGLPNRQGVRREIESLIGRGSEQSFVVVFLDLDDFKRVNDSFGHDTGDKLLCAFVARVRAVVAEWLCDDASRREPFLARLGGDEFVLLVDGGNDAALAEDLVGRVLESSLLPYNDVKSDLVVATSAGMAQFPDDGERVDRLLKCADIAMYAAKALGKRRYRRFERRMVDAVMLDVTIERELRAALRDRRIEVAYQPICELETGAVVAAEALVRWNSESLGQLAPTDFLPVAERAGMIDELTHQVLARVLDDLTLPGLPEDFRVGINVTAQQLQGPVVADAIIERLSGARGSRQIAIEITESTRLEHAELAAAAVARLKQAGVPVWLDDFGTGFSALSHLHTLNPDGVKIDRGFVQQLAEGNDSSVVDAVVAVAQRLGLGVVAEGVETDAVRERLLAMGLRRGQGYWFGRPSTWCALINRMEVGRGPRRRVA